MKGTGWTTSGCITGSIPGLLSPWCERAAITGGIVNGKGNGCTPGGGGVNFFIGGLGEDRVSPGEALLCTV